MLTPQQIIDLVDATIIPNNRKAVTAAQVNRVVKELARLMDGVENTNVANSNLVFDDHHTTNVNHKNWSIEGVMTLDFSANTSPGSSPSFQFNGYSSDWHGKLFSVNNGSSLPAVEISGDLVTKFYGQTEHDNGINVRGFGRIIFGSDPNVFIQHSTGSNGVQIGAAGSGGGVNASWYFGWNYGEVIAAGMLGTNPISFNNTYPVNQLSFLEAGTGLNWQVGKNFNDFVISGNLGPTFSNNNIIYITQSDGTIVFPLGLIDLSALPTSAPAASGMMYKGPGGVLMVS